jgi:hypothetical protein
MAATPLYVLIDRLTAPSLAGKRLRREFHDDPAKVVQDLSDDARAALYAMKRITIGVRVAKEYEVELPPNEASAAHSSWWSWFEKWQFPTGEFPRQELPAECAAEPAAEYPDPQPKVYSINPPMGAAGSANLPIEIVGQGFVKGKTSFQIEDSSKAVVPSAMTSFTGTFRCAHLTGTVTVPAQPGATLFVRVFVDRGDGVKVEVPSNVTFAVT